MHERLPFRQLKVNGPCASAGLEFWWHGAVARQAALAAIDVAAARPATRRPVGDRGVRRGPLSTGSSWGKDVLQQAAVQQCGDQLQIFMAALSADSGSRKQMHRADEQR